MCCGFFSLQYVDGEEVVLWMNTVGPYHNRQETYSYFSLPFCPGPKQGISHYHETLSEALQGVELLFSGLDIDFKGNYIWWLIVSVFVNLACFLVQNGCPDEMNVLEMYPMID